MIGRLCRWMTLALASLLLLPGMTVAQERGGLDGAARIYERVVQVAEQQGHPLLATYQGRLESVTQKLDGRWATAASLAPDTVHVAPPTGIRDLDRASILAALDQAGAGTTVLFSAGTYLVGEIIWVEAAGLTFLGHPDGTTLRGCEAGEFDEMERALIASRTEADADPDETLATLFSCSILKLVGGNANVWNLTFEKAWSGLILGCCHVGGSHWSAGGYHIENNTFREIYNGVRPLQWATDPTVIRRNRFVNTFHAVSAGGSHFHVLDNDISVPEPARVPAGIPGFAINIGGWSESPGDDAAQTTIIPCESNVVAGNQIEGHPMGISYRGSVVCRNNVVLANTIVAARMPVYLAGPSDPEERDGAIGGNVIEGNRITGADGVAIALIRASGNRVADNVITDVESRDPCTGTLLGERSVSPDVNGAGIWISFGSDQNEISANLISGTAGAAIVLEGDGNTVEMVNLGDEVRDAGAGNTVSTGTGQTDRTSDGI
jgi:hypothetical protein